MTEVMELSKNTEAVRAKLLWRKCHWLQIEKRKKSKERSDFFGTELTLRLFAVGPAPAVTSLNLDWRLARFLLGANYRAIDCVFLTRSSLLATSYWLSMLVHGQPHTNIPVLVFFLYIYFFKSQLLLFSLNFLNNHLFFLEKNYVSSVFFNKMFLSFFLFYFFFIQASMQI